MYHWKLIGNRFIYIGLLPDAIQTDCSKCTNDQKRNSRKVITFLRTRRPQDWKKLTDKYDPQGLYNKRAALAWAQTNAA